MTRRTRTTIPADMHTANSLRESAPLGALKSAKKERTFDLALPALVKGLEAAGRRFEERTAVCAISSQEVSFRLKSRLLIGSKVVIALDIPRTLILENPMRMVLSGAVNSVRFEAGANGQNQYVSVRLDRGFRLQPNPYPSS